MLNQTLDIQKDFKPFVTVYVPAYNAEATIKEALDSILAQTYKNFDIVVINDGSTDRTREIILEYKKTKKVRLINHVVNRGVTKIYNEIYKICGSEFICIYHADDTYDPKILEKSVAVLRANKELGICFALSSHSMAHVPDEFKQSNSNVIKFNKQKLFLALMKYYNFLVTPTACIRTSVIKACNIKMGKEELLPKLVQGDSGCDLQMWLDLGDFSGLAVINEPLINWRQHQGQLSRTTKKGLKTVSDFVNVIEYNIENKYLDHIPKDSRKFFELIKFKELNIAALNGLLDFDEEAYDKSISSAMKALKNIKFSFLYNRWARKKILKYVLFHYFLRSCRFISHRLALNYIKIKYFADF
ncbi:glycosyltransferase family 2 protein [Paracoccaceae bacterium]|nr:glycosyltransferase family 2 protein [Paracoccaceae bacterium]